MTYTLFILWPIQCLSYDLYIVYPMTYTLFIL